MKLFIAGASGFVGSAIVRAALEAGHSVVALVRNSNTVTLPEHKNLSMAEGDPFDFESYRIQLSGCDALINTIGIIRENRRKNVTFERIHHELNGHLLAAAKWAGIKRYVLISADGASRDGVSRYLTSKFSAEQDVMESGIDWTILRPSFVIGRGAGFIKEITPVVKLPLVPIFGSGEYSFDPVDIRVLAQAAVRSLTAPEATNKLLGLYGPESVTYKRILSTISSTLGRKQFRPLHIPPGLMKLNIAIFGWLPGFPITRDQLEMLLAGRTGGLENAVTLLNLDWIDIQKQITTALTTSS